MNAEQAPEQAPVHRYVVSGFAFADRILCGDVSAGVNTLVTERDDSVTCERCLHVIGVRSEGGAS